MTQAARYDTADDLNQYSCALQICWRPSHHAVLATPRLAWLAAISRWQASIIGLYIVSRGYELKHGEPDKSQASYRGNACRFGGPRWSIG